ncbi:MAG: exodeoxyribonuclease VII large subunit [Oscillospiraceae bacterium]|nr:exodeoxyribonuclease VII large subunit [Oscillospiraceae bacterium]
MSQDVLSVAQINEYIRNVMDRDALLSSVAVRGEISNYKLYPSGHHYFTLKDDQAAIRCVIFKGNALRLRFRPANGMKIVAMGKISVFPRDGAYQLYCTTMMLDGVGDLHAAFEQLKAKLSAQGLFDPAHKKPIPRFPKTIGIVTSSAGAALHDMLRILRKRYPLAKVVLLSARVQGVEAPREIAAAIRYADHHQLADVLIVGRGGGSIEDLWAFNEEIVARAIYDCRIPVISAVGHEPDVTISDYVADLRAATPSNAAELVVPDQDALCQTLDQMSAVMATSLDRQIRSARRHLSVLSSSGALQEPTGYLKQRRITVQNIEQRLSANMMRIIDRKKQGFLSSTAKLDAMSPLKVLTRGYAMVQQEDGSLLRTVKQVKEGETITISLSDGTLSGAVTGIKEANHESDQL